MAIDEINNHPDFYFSFTGHVRDPRGVITEYHTVCDDLIRNTGVEHIIGCYTSASRKQVLPIVERTDRLLWYPARYEGFECSDNVIYVGASPNHNVLPLVRYMLDNISRHVFCVGSNYVWTWETNRVTRELVTAAHGSILAERLLELGESAVDHIVDEIVRRKPPVIFNTLVGSSSYDFIRAFHAATTAVGLEIPMLSCSLCEPELKIVGPASAGCITSSAYFESIELPENRAFVQRWKARYGEASSPSVDGQSATTRNFKKRLPRRSEGGENPTPRATVTILDELVGQFRRIAPANFCGALVLGYRQFENIVINAFAGLTRKADA